LSGVSYSIAEKEHIIYVVTGGSAKRKRDKDGTESYVSKNMIDEELVETKTSCPGPSYLYLTRYDLANRQSSPTPLATLPYAFHSCRSRNEYSSFMSTQFLAACHPSTPPSGSSCLLGMGMNRVSRAGGLRPFFEFKSAGIYAGVSNIRNENNDNDWTRHRRG
jgi:hypothetical protein